MVDVMEGFEDQLCQRTFGAEDDEIFRILILSSVPCSG